MSRCPPAEQLRDLLADRLGGPEAESLKAHVETCAPCQQVLEHLTGNLNFGKNEEAIADKNARPLSPFPHPSTRVVDADEDFLRRLEKNPSGGAWSLQTPASGCPVVARSPDHATTGFPDRATTGLFPPGMTLAGRYRIVAVLGRGGMGEVYRADDLKLDQPVALKFLPRELATDRERLARLHHEVRIARQVSHPNVCRVHDIGEMDGQAFLTMEYIDGEDLGSLLRRIGRLPEDKGIEIASQLCSGLAAAHDQGVLHRDLKPQNVMIDGRGRVRITDFGLAGFAEEFHGTEIRAGTPAYQAPEQLAGRAVTAQSDLYALGLVLYEMFTGRRAFSAASREELLRLYEQQTPLKPSAHVSGLSPAVERILLRCLEKDPRDRPKSAMAVLAGLPVGDPLAAALAAGETPSPELVADAGPEGSLHPLIGLSMLATILCGIFAIALLNDQVKLFRRVPLGQHAPEILAYKAGEIVRHFGYTDRPADSAHGFSEDQSLLKFLKDHDASPLRWEGLATGEPAAMYFWYRQSPQRLHSTLIRVKRYPSGVPGWISLSEPAPVIPGMVAVCLDPKGRLIEFHAVPPHDGSQRSSADFDWSIPLEKAGLDPAKAVRTTSQRTPPVYCDQRAAWLGVYPDLPDTTVRVEAGVYDGKIVYFHVGPDQTLERLYADEPAAVLPEPTQGAGWAARDFVVVAVILTIQIGGAFLAWRNLRRGRANRRGALRLALYFFCVFLLSWVLSIAHFPSFDHEMPMLCAIVGQAGVIAVMLWIAYLAGEPYLRRRWPWRIIAWNRVLAGRFRDPLVGRHVLIGGLFAVGLILLRQVEYLAPAWFGWPASIPTSLFEGALTKPFYYVLRCQFGGAMEGFISFALLFVLFLVCRREWLAIGVYLTQRIALSALSADYPALDVVFSGVSFATGLFLLLRCGFFAFIVNGYFCLILSGTPITTDLSAWYSTSALVNGLALMALAAYGFIVSLGSWSPFRDLFFQSE